MRILVTRPETEIARFAKQLQAHGIEPIAAPMLRIEPVISLPPVPENAQALLFTSANGVRAFADLSTLRHLPVFTVGDATAEAARAAGFAAVESASGEWRALAARVAAKLDPRRGPLLHPAGEDRAGDLPGALAEAGFELVTIIVYRAVAAEALPVEARAAIAEGTADGVALFSPRSAGIFAALLDRAGLAEKRAALDAFCLSAPVAAALGDPTAWRAVRVAERPNAEALLALIRAQENRPNESPAPHAATPNEPEVAKAMNDERAAYTGNDAERVIAAFGGIRPMAKAMGIAVTTVQGWKERGAIPLKRMDEIRAGAARHGIDLEAALAGPAGEAAEAPSAQGPASPSSPFEAPPHAERPAAERVSADRLSSGPAPGLRAAEAAPPPPPHIDIPAPPGEPGRARWAFWGAGFGAAFVAGGVLAMALGLGGRGSNELERQALDRLQARINTITSQLEEQQKRQQGEAAAIQARINRVEAAERAIGEQRERLAGLAGNAAALASRLERLDMDMKALAARAGTGTPGAEEVRGLKDQIEALAKRVEGLPRPAPDAAGIAAETAAQVKQLADRLAAVEKRATDLAEARPGAESAWKEALDAQAATARAAAEKLAADSAQLRRDVSAIQAQVAALAEVVRKNVADGAGPLAVAVGQLRRAVAEGSGYRAALDAAAALAKDRAEMAPAFVALAARADRGVPSQAQLRQRFDRVAVAALRAAAAPGATADVWDRIWSRVSSLIVIRRTGEVPGETAAAQISRAEAAVARGDLAEAVKQMSALTGPAREAAAGWIGDAQARIEADAALAQLDRALMTLLRAEPKARP